MKYTQILMIILTPNQNILFYLIINFGRSFMYPQPVVMIMKGLSSASNLLFISQELALPDGGVAVTREVTLPLNTLDRQIFVVTDIQAYVGGGQFSQSSAIPNQDVDYSWSVSTQDLDNVLVPGATGDIGNPRVLAAGGSAQSIGATSGDVLRHSWSTATSTTGTPSDYLGIIATPDFFLRGQFNNAAGLGTATLYVRVVGYMATATADLYAALVTQELNQN